MAAKRVRKGKVATPKVRAAAKVKVAATVGRTNPVRAVGRVNMPIHVIRHGARANRVSRAILATSANLNRARRGNRSGLRWSRKRKQAASSAG